jgi:hypothetical protein
VQQLVIIKTLTTITLTASSIPICSETEMKAPLLNYGQQSRFSAFTPSVMAAIYTGLLGTLTHNITAACSTGNCTFSTYQTLGFCNRCVNLTDHITYSFPNGSTFYNWMALPNGLKKMGGTGTIMVSSLVDGRPSDFNLSDKSTPKNYRPADIFRYTALLNDQSNETSTETGAIECVLSLCLHEIETTVLNGKLNEMIAFIPAQWTYDYQEFGNAGTVGVKPAKCSATDSQKNHACSYSFPWNYASALWFNFQNILTGNATNFGGTRYKFDSPATQFIYGSGSLQNISDSFTALAREISNQARMDPSICKDMARGTEKLDDNVFQVHWPWIILPVLVVLVSIIFSAIVMARNSKLRVWKSSPLPLLFMRLDSDLVQGLNQGSTLQELDRRTEKLVIRYDGTEEGWGLQNSPASDGDAPGKNP